jgi:hypothetical protein
LKALDLKFDFRFSSNSYSELQLTLYSEEFKNQTIFFSYFQVNQKYYIFFSTQKPISIHFLYQSVDILEKLSIKQRKLRSFRGFLLYALEIIDAEKDFEILFTNLQHFFGKKLNLLSAKIKTKLFFRIN